MSTFDTCYAKGLVCQYCWNNVFNTQQWQDFWMTDITPNQKFSYKMHSTELCPDICAWCACLFRAHYRIISRKWPAGDSPNMRLEIELSWESYDYMTPKTRAVLKFRLVEGVNEHDGDSISIEAEEFAIAVHGDNPAAKYISTRPTQNLQHILTSKDKLRLMFDSCKSHHECVPRTDSKFPTRLIGVSTHPDPSFVKLVHTDNGAGLYLALSYTWGSRSDEISLTTDKSVEWKEKIPVSQLPCTIRDAISVTRQLGVQYLWVDALCIIQDSTTDKSNEIPKMLDTYSNATAVIVAASAPDASQGFLQSLSCAPSHSPNENGITCCHLHMTLPVRIGPDHFGSFESRCVKGVLYDESTEAVNTRAWTLQEQVMAKRLLVFTSSTIQWRCNAGTVNLDGSIYLPTNYDHHKAGSSLEELSEPTSPDPTLALIQWLHIVEVYSHRALSMLKDRLVAISGLARRFAPAISSDYIAGLWTVHLVHQLCWARDDSSDHQRQSPGIVSKACRAPSWSWASTDSGIEFILPRQNFVTMYKMRFWWKNNPKSIVWPSCRVASLNVEHMPGDPFVDVRSAQITINTDFRKAWIIPSTSHLLWSHNGGQMYEHAEDALQKANQLLRNGYDLYQEPHEMYSSRCFRLDRHEADGLPVFVTCIALLCNHHEVFGMLLCRDGDLWRRVGLFHNVMKADFSDSEFGEFEMI